MTQQLTTLALQNEPLLRALKAGGADSPTALAERAGILPNHVHRKLEALEAEGLITRDADAPKHLAALTTAAEAALAVMSIRMIPVDLIVPWAGNPRSAATIAVADIEDMARSVADKGVLQPLIVRPTRDGLYEVIIGERRRLGCDYAVGAGWKPADFLVPCFARDLSDDEAEELAGIENLQRDDMHWMDEAKWYLRLSTRHSAASIERLVGGARGKRSIQDYTKIARELSPEDRGRTYLPDGHKDQLTYVKARDLVGDKKEKPALDLSPKLALAFLEIIHAGLEQGGWPQLSLGSTLNVKLFTPPTGGPIVTLANERKLIVWAFAGADVVAQVKLSDEVWHLLQQTGFLAGDVGAEALRKAREAVLGPLQASVHPDGQYVAPELNAPPLEPAKPDPEPEPVITPAQRRVLREIAARSLHRYRILDNWVHASAAALEDPDYLAIYDLGFTLHKSTHEGIDITLTRTAVDFLKANAIAPEDAKSANSCATPWLRTDPVETPADPAPAAPAALPGFHDDDDDDGEGDECERLDEPAPTVHQDQTPAPIAAAPAPPPAPTVPPIMALVLVELAHRIATDGIEVAPGLWGIPVLAGFHKDARGAELVQKHRMILFRPSGQRTFCCLTPAGLDWLAAEHVVDSEGGRPILADAEVALRRAGGGATETPYSTVWLNPPSEEAPRPAEATAPAAPADTFGAQLRQLGQDARAVQALEAAARQAEEFLTRLKTLAKVPKAAEIEPVIAILAAGRDGVAAQISEAA